MTTILDVARHALVSTATVSRVLSQPDIVREATRLRVMRAVDELGYEPNLAARTLRTLRSSKLLLMVPDISNPFFSKVIRGAEQMAREASYAVVLGDTGHDPSAEDQYVGMLRRREVDGLVFLGYRLPEALEAEVAKRPGQIPVVNACEYVPGLGVSSVHIDNAAAGEQAMAHLLDLGHRDIGVITGPLNSPLSRDRLAGAQRAVAARGLLTRLVVGSGDFSIDSGLEQALSLLERGVTGLFCFSDEMAIGALDAIRACELICPNDVSVVGFDDIRFARYMTPPLTTIGQPSAEIGRSAVRLLLRTISGDLRQPEVVALPHQLIVRASTACAP
ncbi:LacI family DNA-binding transcriptional regulator [Sphingobium sp. HBC34]|uniref:LacI family DNA-binding transcriptional regulator n=1 Tax=Sphingobium cyanobacteriorum TaxID=3063954 RepID=A0ABT8ZSI1_9SPHN|nr:LacI family DNA-binding transcriptional regulator [Sphingobium sp. HBC34]MDO7837494.1 LacI family DNA-binding transcriptional regulator [Sphingobium sp. HBC34]